MEKIIAALTEIVTANGTAERKRPVEVDVDDAPPCGSVPWAVSLSPNSDHLALGAKHLVRESRRC